MAAPPDDRTPLAQSEQSQKHILKQFHGDWVDRLNLAQMFVLIDGVLPFEACLYYQVLPLFLEGNRLNLGMVSPEDTTAADYVRRIISYLNYSLVARQIPADALQATLTAYLNNAERKQTPTRTQTDSSSSGTRVSFGHHRHAGRNRGTPSLDQSERLTLVVDSPDELEAPVQEPEQGDPAIQSVSPASVVAPPSSASESSSQPPSQAGNHPARPASPSVRRPKGGEAPRDDIPQPQQPVLPLMTQLPVLQLRAEHLSSPAEVLLTLPPDVILQELLARVLVGGIGRLYFENHGHYGRILWSQNGVLQSVLENVPIALFEAILAALKQKAEISLPIQSYPQQVEVEYLYEKLRVLLRFRFMLNSGSEEATLQILRGAALKFHQQQQVRKLERDAMGIAKQLQVKLNEIRDRAQTVGGLTSSRFEVLPGLSDLLRRIEQQLDEMGVSQSDQP